jgi:hypothetical protein
VEGSLGQRNRRVVVRTNNGGTVNYKSRRELHIFRLILVRGRDFRDNSNLCTISKSNYIWEEDGAVATILLKRISDKAAESLWTELGIVSTEGVF